MRIRPLMLIGAVSGALVLSPAGFAQALAAPAEPSPVGGDGHSHHVLTGNGDCVDIDSVLFEPDVRGLHHAVQNSITGGRDVLSHGACEGLGLPGGPPPAEIM